MKINIDQSIRRIIIRPHANDEKKNILTEIKHSHDLLHTMMTENKEIWNARLHGRVMQNIRL